MVSASSYHGQLLKPWTPPAQKAYIFTNVNLVDVEAGVIHENATVKLSGGRIEQVELQHSSEGMLKSSNLADVATRVDLRGKYLCPGLFDCHVHIIAVPGEIQWQDTKSLNPTTSAYRHAHVCKQMLDRGFTTVRDYGGAQLSLKQSIEDGLVQGPRLFIAGNFLSQTGGHGDTRGSHDHSNIECCGGGSSNFPSFICDGVPECLRATRENIRTGSDFIKIMGGGGVCSPTDRIDNVQFTSEEISAITTVAKNSQTYVTSHAYTPQSIRQAMENGVMGIEHGNMIDKETAELMAQKGAYLTPTLVTYTAMGDEKFAGYMPAESMEKNAEVYVAGLRGLKIAADAGVNICYGSDLLGHLGVSQLDEFTIRSKVLPPLAILRSATITPAKMMRQENFLGQIKQGFAADLLILNANPLEDISVLAQPERNLLAVIKDGRVCTSRWTLLDEDAHEVDFHQRVKLRLKTLLKDWAFDTVKKHHEHWRKAKFDRFVAAHPDRPMPPALRTKWDRRNPKRYRNLGRPLDYVLFALRTEYIGLLQHRRELCRSKIDDSYCRLCKDRFKGRLETVYHLLHCCPALKPQRDKLHAEVYATVREIRNPHDMRRLILDKAPKLVAQFALRYFPIDQLEWTRTHMLDLLSEQADDGGDGD